MTVCSRLVWTHKRLLSGAALTICLLASGCGSKSAAPTVPTLPGAAAQAQSGSGTGPTLAAFRAAIACARAHGMSGLPDPAIDSHGRVILPGLANPPTPTPAVQAACGGLINRAASLAGSGGSSSSQPSAADLTALLRFAHCMRAHGEPHWPDPDPNQPGQFTFASRADLPPKDQAKRLFAPCQQFVPPIGISINFSGNSG